MKSTHTLDLQILYVGLRHELAGRVWPEPEVLSLILFLLILALRLSFEFQS